MGKLVLEMQKCIIDDIQMSNMSIKIYYLFPCWERGDLIINSVMSNNDTVNLLLVVPGYKVLVSSRLLFRCAFELIILY